jgi:CxxC-x17-CxxC domain-containing protein
MYALPQRIGWAMDFVDRELTCVECGTTFVFSAGEQAFFSEKGFKNDPRRCKQCKSLSDKQWKIETQVKCSECGVSTTVPFKPQQKRPVLCRACFQKQTEQPKREISPVEPASDAPPTE